jgi:hypothetical protein
MATIKSTVVNSPTSVGPIIRAKNARKIKANTPLKINPAICSSGVLINICSQNDIKKPLYNDIKTLL